MGAAVEVAAYRIATEALNNAARHARARLTHVALSTDDAWLRLEVADDGVGIPNQAHPRTRGIGFSAMAERAAELGGTCSVDARAGGGTTVVTELPLTAAS